MDWLESPAVAWAVVALVLVIVELVTGTFYLLMLAVAAAAGALSAWAGAPFAAQIAVTGVAAVVGFIVVRRVNAKRSASEVPLDIDAGQTAAFDEWLSEAQRMARVKYRGAPWTARVDGTAPLTAGTLLRITATRGSTLDVTPL